MIHRIRTGVLPVPAFAVLIPILIFSAGAARASGAGRAGGESATSPVRGSHEVTAASGHTDEDSLAALARVNLARHVDARMLAAWRGTCTNEEARAFDFLFAWLPSSDLAAWRGGSVISDIRLALATRAEAPWHDAVDEETFLRFVLPHRVAQEPIEPWRRTLHDLLWPRVKDLSLPEAVLETNRFCREGATFHTSSARDQAPSATMARGLGRCEEETIFFVCAARSVGIPARPCSTPWWTAADGNHAWVEAWTGEGWHYLGACEPENELDRAWFRGPARRAGLVLSLAYGERIPGAGGRGEPVAPGPAVYSRGLGVTLLNSTGTYGTPGRMTVRFADVDPSAPGADGLAQRRAKAPVTVHVFNCGSLVPLGSFAAGDTLILGPQDYFVAAAVDGRPAGAFATVRPQETTVVSLDPRGGDDALRALFARPFTLHIPQPPEPPATPGTPEPAVSTAAATAAAAAASSADAAAAASTPGASSPGEDATTQRIAFMHDAASKKAAAAAADSLRRVALTGAWRARDLRGADAVLAQLDLVPPRAAYWLSFLLATPPAEAIDARALVLEMDDKDLLEADSAGAATVVRESRRVRALRSARATEPARTRADQRPVTPDVADSTWYRYVLSPRIGYQPFDPELWTTLPLLADDQGRPLAPPAIFAAFAAHVRAAEPRRLGHLARPSETWTSGWATPAAARVGLVGLFRRNGIPARLEPEERWVEARFNGRWVPCDPLDATSWDRREGAVAAATARPGHLHAVIRNRGRVMTEAEPWQHFRLDRFTGGRFSPFDGDYQIAAGVLDQDLEPGSWWLFGGIREDDGSPIGRALPFTLASGESLAVDLELGVAAESPAAAGLPPALRARAGVEGPLLFFAWKRHAEPSIRTATALQAALPDLESRGVTLVSMPVVGPMAPSDRIGPPVPGFPSAGPVRILTPGELAPLLEVGAETELPVLILADRDGAVLLRLAGLRPDAADRVRDALNRLDASGRARPE